MKIAVVGAGVSGLSAARALRDRAEVTVFEAGPRVGGVLQTHRRGDLLLEEGPDSLVATKPEAIRVAEELGVPLIGTENTNARSMVVRDGRLAAVPEGFVLLAPTKWGPLLRSPIFSWAGKARMALDLVLPRGGGASDPEVDEPLAAMVRRRLGAEALDRLAQPMLGGVVAGDPEQLSARSVMPMLVGLERTHRSIILGMQRRRRAQLAQSDRKTSGARYALFRTPRDGMSAFADALAEGVDDLRLDTPVREVRRRGPTWTVDGERFDRVVVALPIRAAQAVLDGDLSSALATIPSTSTATVNLVYRASDVTHPLPAFGFVVPAAEGLSLMACTFTTRKYAGRADAGHFVLRAFVGGALGRAAYARADDAVIAAVRADLRGLLGLEAEPLQTHLVRWDDRFPQLNIGHRGRVAAVRAACAPGLALAGNYFDGAGISDCLRSGREAAERIVGGQRRSS